ncbi:cell wall metabolism sensor histidine kinase WalK [Streptomyces sp. NP160]|uniref:sensor histidine kinase n=1 Tax=Streptomyces sp. NP160 TaxID=2586637 RepID=UPI00214C5AF3|nr:HAMP domain-containing sensor histidine kinase [Streptomyces sp. NP160]
MPSRRRQPTLQGRLTAALVVLVLLVTGVTGMTTALVLRASLLSQLDSQLADAGGRYSAEVDRRGTGDAGDNGPHGGGAGGSGRPSAVDPDRGLGRGQSVGTLGVILSGGQVVQASVVGRDGATTTVDLDAASAAALAAVRPGSDPASVDLGALGDYRVRAVTDDGATQVTGLPLATVGAVLRRVVLGELALGLLAAAAGGVMTALVVRRGLRPLQDVTTTALRITELPLAGSAGGLPGPVTSPGSARGSTAEVSRVSGAVDAMVDHVRAALQVRDAEEERRRRFMADASHELRTPLAVVQAHTEQALRSGRADGVRPSLERIAVASDRMGHLVEDLLLLAHLDAGRPLASEPVPLSQLVLEELVDARAAGPDHAWEADLPEEPVDVDGDAQRLHQVVAGLLTNARRHTPAGTTVTMTVREVAVEGRGWVELDIADDGPGVPADLRERVFERFTRADSARTTVGSTGGSGLGLAIARGIAVAHGGDLLLLPAAQGAVFRLRLPAPAAASL